jgi:zinc transport system substrate-binding protein
MFWRRLGLYLVLPACLTALLAVSGCITAPDPWPPGSKPPRVLVTIPPLYSFVKNVAGDHATIRCLCTTTGPHHYESDSVQDAMQLRTANLFLAIGLGLDEKFADRMAEHSQNPNLRYIRLGNSLPAKLKLKTEDHDEDEKDHKDHKDHQDHKDAHGHEHGEFDPHVWLGIEQAKNMVEQIRDALKVADPDTQHAKDYDANAAKYLETLEKLREDGKKSLKDKKNLKIISFHESLEYFEKSFGIDIVGVIERAPGSTPTSGDINDLVKLCKEKDVRVIAVEPQYASNNVAAQLQKELGGGKVLLVEVDPLETAEEKELKSAKWYEERMRANIDNLAKALP